MGRQTQIPRHLAGAALLLVFSVSTARAEFTLLAHYRMGEEDGINAIAGATATGAAELVEFNGMEIGLSAIGTPTYSADTPPGSTSTLSVQFDGSSEYFSGAGVAWHSQFPGFRVGMEAWLKVDPDMAGRDFVPFGNGSLYHLRGGSDGFYHANSTPAGKTQIKYGEWQHVAFWTTGSFWQVYVDGEAQYDNLPNFNYGGGGDQTIGAGPNGGSAFEGLIDEFRIFTWTGAFNTADLTLFTGRQDGDVNGDLLVDATDYNIWRTNVGRDLSGVSPLDGRALGDVNGDGLINLDDFGLIKANRSGAPAPGTVPEPSAATLLLAGLSGLFIRRRNRRRA